MSENEGRPAANTSEVSALLGALRALSANGRTSLIRATAIDAHDQLERLHKAAQYALSGLAMAYKAVAGKRYDEALLHCGHHEAMLARALLRPNASLTGGCAAQEKPDGKR